MQYNLYYIFCCTFSHLLMYHNFPRKKERSTEEKRDNEIKDKRKKKDRKKEARKKEIMCAN